MGTDEDNTLSAAELRRQAEERLQAKKAEQKPSRAEEMPRLVHELEVHQIELELQNAELRHARDQVETVLTKYTDLYDFAPVGYFTLDRDGVISAANLSGAELFGKERARLIGRHFGLLVAKESREHFRACLSRVFAGQGKVSSELTLAGEGRHQRTVHIEAVAFAQGRECRFAVIDITERKRAEAELAEKRHELEEVNRSLQVRIGKAVEELRQKDEMLILQDRLSVLGEMIHNIAHQWKQPLNVLGLVVQQLPYIFDSGKLSRDVLMKQSESAMDQIQHMSRTIEDFRSLFRADKEAISFSINEVIERTLSLIGNTFKDHKISIALHLEGNPMVTGFPNEYSQVLLNILLNARDVLTGNHVEDPRISIHSCKEGDRSVVTITDNGGGIADEHMGKVFDAYFTTKDPDKGTGIGLFMSKTIIEKSMRGRLTVRNADGGAEFKIEV